MAEKIREASQILDEITHELPNGTEKGQKVRQLEHLADEITRQTYERLNDSLITPLEPEEIARLAPALDDVLDRIDWVTHQVCSYGIPQSTDLLKEFSYLIVMSSREIAHGIDDLATLKKAEEVAQHARELNRLYNISTELLSRAVLELFQTKDVLMIIKLKDIYEGLAKVMEKTNDVGHALSDIARNHA
jgi:uncharacterized protein Yka (UPF0111/DUF47 family)